MVSRTEFEEWKSSHATREFFGYLEECRQNLLEQPSLRETIDQTVQATAYKQGQIDMIQSMMQVDFAGE